MHFYFWSIQMHNGTWLRLLLKNSRTRELFWFKKICNKCIKGSCKITDAGLPVLLRENKCKSLHCFTVSASQEELLVLNDFTTRSHNCCVCKSIKLFWFLKVHGCNLKQTQSWTLFLVECVLTLLFTPLMNWPFLKHRDSTQFQVGLHDLRKTFYVRYYCIDNMTCDTWTNIKITYINNTLNDNCLHTVVLIG